MDRTSCLDQLQIILGGQSDALGWDWSIKFETAFQCAWSVELRITKKPNQTKDRRLGIIPDVSAVYYLSGLPEPEAGARALLPVVRDLCRKKG